jgi:hypothetical protein
MLLIYQCVMMLEIVRFGFTSDVAANAVLALFYLIPMACTRFTARDPGELSEPMVAIIKR